MFLDLMPKLHAGAIRMAKDALKKAKHPEIKAVCSKGHRFSDGGSGTDEEMEEGLKTDQLTTR
jgi:hypothetical protein